MTNNICNKCKNTGYYSKRIGNMSKEKSSDVLVIEKRKTMELKVKRLTETAKLPTKAHKTDAGFDLYADEEVYIEMGNVRLVSTGIAMKIPDGYCGIIKDRSSFGVKGHATLAGVIDSAYVGEIKVVIHSVHGITITKGMKFAQILIVPVPECEVVEVQDLDNTVRGCGGFGSTGN